MIQPNRLNSPIISIEHSLVAFLKKKKILQKEKYIDYFKSLLQTTPCSSKHKMSLSSGCHSAVQTWSALDFLTWLANQWAHLFPSLEVWPAKNQRAAKRSLMGLIKNQLGGSSSLKTFTIHSTLVSIKSFVTPKWMTPSFMAIKSSLAQELPPYRNLHPATWTAASPDWGTKPAPPSSIPASKEPSAFNFVHSLRVALSI